MNVYRSLINTEYFTFDGPHVKDRIKVCKGDLVIELSVWLNDGGAWYLLPSGAIAGWIPAQKLLYRKDIEVVGVSEDRS